jgi:hypothetical protein
MAITCYLTTSENRCILSGTNVDHLSEVHSTAMSVRAHSLAVG